MNTCRKLLRPRRFAIVAVVFIVIVVDVLCELQTVMSYQNVVLSLTILDALYFRASDLFHIYMPSIFTDSPIFFYFANTTEKWPNVTLHCLRSIYFVVLFCFVHNFLFRLEFAQSQLLLLFFFSSCLAYISSGKKHFRIKFL